MWKTKVHAVGKELEPPSDGDWVPVAFVPKDGTSMVVVWEHDPEAYGERDRSAAWQKLCETLPEKVFGGDGKGVDKVITYIDWLKAMAEEKSIDSNPEARLWTWNRDTHKNEPLVREELLKEAKRALRRSRSECERLRAEDKSLLDALADLEEWDPSRSCGESAASAAAGFLRASYAERERLRVMLERIETLMSDEDVGICEYDSSSKEDLHDCINRVIADLMVDVEKYKRQRDLWAKQCNMASENYADTLNVVARYRKALHQCSRVLAKWVRSERIACDTIVKIGNEHKEVLEQLKRANSTIMQTPSMAMMKQQDDALEEEKRRADRYKQERDQAHALLAGEESLKVAQAKAETDKWRKMYTECCKYAQGWRKRADDWLHQLNQAEARCGALREEAERLRRRYVYATPAQWDARMPKTIWAKRQPIENDPGHIACSDTPCPDGSSLPYVLGSLAQCEGCQECHGDGCARDNEGMAMPDKPCRSCDGEGT